MTIQRWVKITPESVIIDGKELHYESQGLKLLTEVYRKGINDYPKFFKMDALSKLGFIATEMLLKDEPGRFVPREDRAVVFLSRCGSLCDDVNYQKTISDANNYFPSPSVFVYTLPNIVTGEVAIRNKYFGETCSIITEKLDAGTLVHTISDAFQDEATTSVIGGWLDCEDEEHFLACLLLTEKEDKQEHTPCNIQAITKIINLE
jgi:hypothetical protein